jgi:tripartite-type tricarboxylate transporter receptor subunit TctC
MRSAWYANRRALLALLLGCSVFGSFAPADAQDAGMPLKGETVRIYVGFSPGGGYDAYARMLAPVFFSKCGASMRA